jgi:hypothetical protein
VEQLLNINMDHGLGTPVSAEPAAVEAPVETQQSVEPVKEGLSSPRLLAIAQKERANLQRRMELKRYDAQLRQREAQVKQYEQLKSQAKLNPLKTIESLGINYTDLTNFVLNNGKPTPEIEIGAVKSELEQMKQAQIQREQQARIQAKQQAEREVKEVIDNYRESVDSFVMNNPSEYKLINKFDAQDMIVSTTQEYFERTRRAGNPKILSNKEAADLVEQYLRDQVTEGHSLLQPPQAKATQAESSQRNQSRTLNNEMISSAPSMLPAATENDRIKRALAMLG